MKAEEPHINEDGYLLIREGRHPLIDEKKVVPINVSIGKDYRTLVVTGPNTGGKTVTLKTVSYTHLFNAKSVADKGGAILIEEKNLTSEMLIEEVMRLKNNTDVLRKMCRASRESAPIDATELIYSEIKKDE